MNIKAMLYEELKDIFSYFCHVAFRLWSRRVEAILTLVVAGRVAIELSYSEELISFHFVYCR